MSSHDIENVDLLAFFAVPLKTGPKAWAAANLPLTFSCKTKWARECTRPLASTQPTGWSSISNKYDRLRHGIFDAIMSELRLTARP